MNKTEKSHLVLAETFQPIDAAQRQAQIQRILDAYLRQQLQK